MIFNPEKKRTLQKKTKKELRKVVKSLRYLIIDNISKI